MGEAPTSVSIQSLRPTDWERLRSTRLRALADTPDAFGSVLAREQEYGVTTWRERLSGDDRATFVATLPDGSDVGLIGTAPHEGHAGLFSLWVAPEARGQGVGGALVDAVIDWAKSQNHSKILLDVGDKNTPAIALYVSKGFEPNGVIGTLDPPREHITEHQRVLHLIPVNSPST